MGMPVQQDVPRLQKRHILHIMNVPVRRVNKPVSRLQNSIIRQYRKLQNHLIHFGIAVAADAEDFVFPCVQHRGCLFCIIPLRKIVARAMI